MSYTSEQDLILSGDEMAALEALGGIQRTLFSTDRILAKYGLKKGLFNSRERRKLLQHDVQTHQCIVFSYDNETSVGSNFKRLVQIILDLGDTETSKALSQRILKYLVGAQLDLVIGNKTALYQKPAVSGRLGADFQLDGVVIYISTHPSEALIRQCGSNLKSELKPVIVTLDDGVVGAIFLLKNAGIDDRVDVLDITQFLSANLYERSFFSAAEHESTFASLLNRYNEIVAECDTDPVLQIRMD